MKSKTFSNARVIQNLISRGEPWNKTINKKGDKLIITQPLLSHSAWIFDLVSMRSLVNHDTVKWLNKTKDWALVQNAAFAGGVKVELGLFR